MKTLSNISACALLAAGLVTSAFGQIQVATTLLVDVDATGQPVGTLAFLTNNGAMGGVFVATNSGVAGVTPQIIALGGNGTHGVMLDGNQVYLTHATAATGGTALLAPAGLTGANPDFSVEVWEYKATINNDGGPVSWGTRTTGQNAGCNWGRSTGFGGLSWQGGGFDHGWASLPAAGVWHHLVWTYDATAVGTNAGTIRLYRDGVLDKAEIQGAPPTVNAAYNILLGAQHNGAAFANWNSGVLGKVRIHDGVLDASQVLNNYNYEAAAFTNGTPAALLTTAPLHRYSFNLPATNNAIGLTVPDTGTAAGAPGIIRGTTLAAAAIPYFDGNQLVLQNYGGANSGATNGYVDLPNNMLSSLSSSNGGPGATSFELWTEPLANRTWSELLYFGNGTAGEITTNGGSFTGVNGFVIPAQVNTSVEQGGVRGAAGDRVIGCYLMGSRKHIVATWDEASNLIKLYHQGVQVAQFTANVKMNAIVDVNNWLGRSGWAGDAVAAANYREFRIYNRVLSPAEIRLDYLVGPYDAQDGSIVTWNGNLDGNWDGSTYNWLVNGVSTNFANGNDVRFDDTATGTTTINLATTVTPKSILVNNSTKSYTIGGAGNISGTNGLTKVGNNTLTFTGPQTNDYTGPNSVVGGKVIVSNLANGGLPSAIGAASANRNNLVLSGGTLSYQGPTTTIDRGYLVAETISTLEVQNGLTLSGSLGAASPGGLAKTGPGTLTYISTGSNLLSAGAFPGYQVMRGAVVFDGTAGGQTNRNMSEFWVGSSTNYSASLTLISNIMYLDTWLSVGRGNGNIGNTATLTLNSSVVNIAANGLSMGYNGGVADYLATQVATLNGTSAINCAGNANIGESAGSVGTLYVNNNSWLKCATPRIGLNAGSTGAVYLANSAALTNTAFTSIGASGVGLMVVKDNAIWSSTGDFNVSDVANSIGELVISNSATVLCNGTVFVGKSAGTVGTVNQSGGSFLKTGGAELFIGGNGTAAATSVGTWNISGGLLSINGTLFPGSYGQGALNQSGGTVLANSWVSIGRFSGSVGALTVSGGLFFATNTATDVIVGEAGSGVLNISGTGLVVATNRLNLGNTASGSGTVNLNGGTLFTKRVFMGNASAGSFFNFNGGLLQAAPSGAAADFMSGLSYASVLAGGARIDTGTNVLTMAQDLNTDYTGGGLTKLGAGSLTLSGNLYYNGPTAVNNGLLGITTHNYGGGSISVADGATLALQVLDSAGTSTIASGLTVGNTAGATLTFNLGSFGNAPTAPLDVSAGTVILNGTTTINIDPGSSLSVGEFPLVSYGTLAGSSTLALGTLPPGVFGYLTNDTASVPRFIGLVVTSVFQPRWEGMAGGDWDIQVTTNWIDLITLTPQFFYQGTRAIFNDEALGTTNVNLVTTVAPGGVLVSNTLLNYTISGVGRISGGGGLTKLGAGQLTLNTTNNNYTGPTVIDEGGTLVATVANNLGTNSALSIGTGTLSLGANNQKFSSVALTNGTIAATTATITAGTYNLDNGSVNALLAGGSLVTFGTNIDLVSVGGGNTYTGRTYLAGSTLAVTNLANGGSPSSIGISSASPTNLVFAGGGLSYNGPGAATDRGYTVESGGRLTASADLTLAGPITATAGLFTKGGNAAVTYTALGTNVLSRGGLNIGAGSVVLNGGASTPASYLQTNIVVGDIWVGYDQANAGTFIVTNTSLSISAWLALDRGNGILGSQSVASFYNSVVNVGNCSLGYANGMVDNWSRSVLNLNGNSRFNDAGTLMVSENAGSDSTVNISGTSVATITGNVRLGVSSGASTGTVQIANSGQLIVNGGSSWLAIGSSGVGMMTLTNNALVTNSRDENVGDVTGSSGTFNIAGNATNITANFYVGKSGTAVGVVNQSGGYLGRLNPAPLVAYVDWRIGGNTAADAAAVGTFNLSGGIIEPFGNFQIGAYGTGSFNQSGGVANCASFPVVGRYLGSVGTLSVSGGTFNQTGTGQLLIIAEDGTGTLNLTSTGTVVSAGGVSIGHTVTGIGLVNLDGGTLRTPRVYQAGGVGASSTFNFNGGVLHASANNANFMTGLGAANVLAGGAVVDSSSNSVTIAQALLDGGTGGGLIKTGTGILALSGVNTYTGLTLVSNGTLQVNGSIVSAVDVKANGTLGGTGTINGNAVVESGASLAPGASVGTLTINGNLSLSGNLFIEVNKALTPSNDLAVVTGTLNNVGSGTVTVTNLNLAQPLVVGDSFKLFSQPLTGGSALTIAGSPGAGLGWTNHLAVDGTIAVIASMALNPTNLNYSLSGSTLTLSWPADHLGWILQSQTNSLSTGLVPGSWFDVPGSAASNTNVITINPVDPTVFFRLRAP